MTEVKDLPGVGKYDYGYLSDPLVRKEIAESINRAKQRDEERQNRVFEIKISNDHLPEQPWVAFKTNGAQGGDGGHGGYATFKIGMDNGSHDARIISRDSELRGHPPEFDLKEFELTVRGDWESNGLVEVLIDLGKQLEKQYPNGFYKGGVDE